MPISEQLAAVCPPVSARIARPRHVHVRGTTGASPAGIEGWFFVGATAVWDALLAFQATTHAGSAGHLLEIGVHQGKFGGADGDARANPAQKLVLVDFELKSAAIEQRALERRASGPRRRIRELGTATRAPCTSIPLVPECFPKFLPLDAHRRRALRRAR
jgi:hypothetical protein